MKSGDLRVATATIFPHLWNENAQPIALVSLRSGNIIMILSTDKPRPKTDYANQSTTEVVILTCHGICFAPFAHIKHVTDELL